MRTAPPGFRQSASDDVRRPARDGRSTPNRSQANLTKLDTSSRRPTSMPAATASPPAAAMQSGSALSLSAPRAEHDRRTPFSEQQRGGFTYSSMRRQPEITRPLTLSKA